MILGILILFFMLLDFNSRMDELNSLKKQYSTVSTTKAEVVGTVSALQTAVVESGSQQVVDEWARAQAHLVKPGDLPVVPVGAATAVGQDIPTPVPMPAPPANWQRWWDLFFGD